jgi:hypothetical protein
MPSLFSRWKKYATASTSASVGTSNVSGIVAVSGIVGVAFNENELGFGRCVALSERV